VKCLVLAGGFGTRLNLNDRAKALLEYKGKSLLTHIVEKVPKGMPILISTNKRFESDFHQWREKHRDREIEILVENARAEEEKFGAVSALNFWVNQKGIAEDLLVIGGDNYFEFNLSDFIAAYDGKNTLIAVRDIEEKSKASQLGIVVLGDKNRIVEFQEKPLFPKTSLVSTACYIFPSEVFPLLVSYCQQEKRDSLGDFIDYLVRKKEVYAYIFKELWFDIGSSNNHRY
jgi:glucose-1-phosphate thymidylyltransferase